MAVDTRRNMYTFPPAPEPGMVEWEGSPIGASNIITRTKGRTASSNKTLDADPALRDRVMSSARDIAERLQAEGTLLTHDVIVHGIRVRAHTNSPHLFNFWTDNWYSAEEWEDATGVTADSTPRIAVYALAADGQEEAAYYSRKLDTIVFFNTSYYGQLKSWVLGAVGRLLASEYGIHSIHGACVEADGRGVVYIAPTGTGKSTSSYGLMSVPGSKFHSDDWVYVRYSYRTRDGRTVSPSTIELSSGERVTGYRCLGWLRAYQGQEGSVRGYSLEGQQVSVPLGDLELPSAPEAYAFISEKVFYLRTNLLESFPAPVAQVLRSKLENVPDVLPEFVAQKQEAADRVVDALPPELATGFDAAQAARLFAFDNSRALLNIADVFGADSVYTNPLRPVKLDDVFLLKRDFSTDDVLERLSEEQFLERLIIGLTPDGKREVAYNAYRAVDDAAERRYITELEHRGLSVGSDLMKDPNKPQSLEEEFTLFQALYDSAACYDLNTTLTKDPEVQDRSQAVDLTIQLIASVVRGNIPASTLTVSTYREALP